jgi:hypothetical protein
MVINADVRVRACVRVCMCVYVHVLVLKYVHTYVCVCERTYACTYVYAHALTYHIHNYNKYYRLLFICGIPHGSVLSPTIYCNQREIILTNNNLTFVR